MFHKSMVAAWCGLGASALVLVGAAPAALGLEDTPSRVVLRDAPADVWRVDVRTSEWTLVGDLPAADVRVARINHRVRAVTIRTRFADLRRAGVQRHWAGIATPDDDFFVEVTTRPRRPDGRHVLYDGAAGEKVACAGLSHRVDYATDRVTARVPRQCLGDPKWVKVNAGNILVTRGTPTRRHYADNPHNREPYSNTGTRRIHRVDLES